MKAKPSLWERTKRALGFGGAAVTAPRRRGGFSGAADSRLTLDWIFAPVSSPDGEQSGDLKKLRARARELVRNTAVGARFVQVMANNVVGAGIRLQAKNLTSEGALHTRANAAIEAAWAEWGRVGVCTIDGQHSLTDVLDLGVRTKATDGEFLVEMVEGPDAGNAFGFALNLLDADLLDEQCNRPRGTDGTNEIRHGVEVNSYGRPVAYWFWESHPADTATQATRRRRRVSADRVLHLFTRRRAHQTRGVTAFAPVLLDVRMLAGYYEAELVAARVAASKIGFVKVDPEIGDASDDLTPGAALPVDADPGTFWRGNPGEELQMFNPEHPVAAFRDFTTSILHHVAAGFGISYGTLTGDLSQANYSSMRVGLLAERDTYKREQRLVVEHMLDRIYRAWLRMALLHNQIPALGSFESSRWLRVEWKPRGFPWIDPKAEIDAAGVEIALGLTTRTDLAAERGRDFEETLEQLQEEYRMIAEYAVPVQTPALSGGGPAPSAGEDADDEDDDKTTSAGEKAAPARSLRALP